MVSADSGPRLAVSSLVNESYPVARPWVDGNLQSVRDRVMRQQWSLPAGPVHRVPLSDGTGDHLVVQLHEPNDEHSPGRTGGRLAARPTVLLVHGLGGSAESTYVRASAAGLTAAGFPVARVDLRSSGLSTSHTSEFYHGGRTADLRDVLAFLAPQAPGGLAVMGFSLGGNAILKLLGEPLGGLPVRAGVAVSAPLDLSEATSHLAARWHGFYDRFLLSKLIKDVADSNVNLSDQERAALARARRLIEFDDAITAPRHGWADAWEYYRVNSSAQFLPSIGVPTLLIHAVDDPMITIASYTAVDWDALATRTLVRRAVTPHGGHVGFHERGKLLPWYVRRAIRHLLAAEQVA
ncbi:MAG: YheT family hydrolase [Candidatus Nanopelagicales bacterium]